MWRPNIGPHNTPNVHPHSIGAAFGNLTIQTLNAPRLAEPTFQIQINELDLHHPPPISWGHEDRFYVAIDIEGQVQTTSAEYKHKLPWKDAFTFDARSSSVITLRVFAERKLHQDTYVGSVQGRLDAFLSSSGKAVLHDISLPHPNSDHHADRKTRTKISFSVKRVGDVAVSGFPSVASEPPAKETNQLITEHHRAKENSWKDRGAERDEPATKQPETDLCHSSNKALQTKPSARDLTTPFGAIIALFPNDNQIQQILDNANAFSPLLEKINLFLTFTDALGDIHPYVKMAAVILTGVVKVFTAQIVFKDNIKNLIETMADAHGFLSESEPLARINSHRQIICALSAQTVECSYFLQDITKRGVGYVMSQQLWMTNTQQKFQEYTQKFQHLRAALQERAVISAAITVLRMYDEVQGISAQITLDNMHYVEDVHYTNVDECDSLEPDGQQLSDEITRWINDGETTERILYLCGPAECGKTAIAREVARLFDGLRRLGSSYFVREPHTPPHHHYQPYPKDPRDPSCIFRNISRDIADHNPQFKKAVSEKAKTCAIRTTSHIDTQFRELILEPAKQISWCGPVVIVIDALDVCVEGHKRKDLLKVLATRAAELPTNFRILVTSRPEKDIVRALEDKPHVVTKILEGPMLRDNDSGISFSPIAPCGRRSPSSASDSVPESDTSEDRGDLTEDNDVYRSYEFFDEQDTYPYTGDTSPPPPYVREDATPRDKHHTATLRTREQADVTFDYAGSPLRRGHTLHLHDSKNGLKSVGPKVYMVVHGHHVDGDVRCRDHLGELAEAEYLEDIDGSTRKSRARATSLRRVKSDRAQVVDTLNRRYRQPAYPAHRSRVIVAHEAIHI